MLVVEFLPNNTVPLSKPVCLNVAVCQSYYSTVYFLEGLSLVVNILVGFCADFAKTFLPNYSIANVFFLF